jgi:outer membrane protein OmpA-like peptidoglycan-associated protein
MADFTLDGRAKIKTIKAQFKENFGATLRVYTTVECKELADDNATLASIRAEGYAGGELIVKGNTKVATFEKKMAELYGIGVQVANADDTAFADDSATLASASSTSSETSGSAHFTVEDLTARNEEAAAPKVEASAAELASARVRVYGQAQNRTVLGIVHAYMIMYPHATMEDLCKAFPTSSINPKYKDIVVEVVPGASQDQLMSAFMKEDELITTGDGKKCAVVMLWTKDDFERMVAHAKQYGILVADFEKAAGGAKRGHFRLEYLNGYVPPVPQKKSKKGLWIVLAILALLIIGLLAALLGRKPETQIVEKEVVVRDTVTVYVQQLEEIEKNFNAAEFVVGKADLSEDAKFVLHDLAKVMQKHPELKLKLVGHTSAEGDPVFNQKLSEQRAQAAVDFLVSHGGVDVSRLEAIGKGSSELKNTADPMAQENRRTEFIIVE